MKKILLPLALLLVALAYFVITKQMRPAPAPMGGMSGMSGGMSGMAMQPAPAGLDLARKRRSDAGLFVAEIAPQSPDFDRNTIHAWRLTLKDAAGNPVSGAEIKADGGMPQHNHGLPTRPEVTPGAEPGQYLIRGLRFHMPGWWELRLDVAAGAQHDSLTFNLMLE